MLIIYIILNVYSPEPPPPPWGVFFTPWNAILVTPLVTAHYFPDLCYESATQEFTFKKVQGHHNIRAQAAYFFRRKLIKVNYLTKLKLLKPKNIL